MHWARWGDPAEAAPLPGPPAASSDGLRPARRHRPCRSTDVRLPDADLADDLLAGLRGLVGAEHVHTDHETRVRHTRGKSTPDLLRMRAGDGSDAPDAVVRPADARRGGRARRAGAASTGSRWSRSAAAPRWSAGSPPGATASPGCVVARPAPPRPAARASTPVSATATLEAGLLGPRGRGAARRARPDARALPAVLRVRLDRRLRRHPVQRPGLVGLRPLRRARRRAHAWPPRSARSSSAARPPTPPAPTCASWCSAPRAPSA